tara:strand:+ start:1999 stop:2964 length:966 start_codon:yes stop_codon:yes gene_type:complete
MDSFSCGGKIYKEGELSCPFEGREGEEGEEVGVSMESALSALIDAEEHITSVRDAGWGYQNLKDNMVTAKRKFIGRDPGQVEAKLDTYGPNRNFVEGMVEIVRTTLYYELEDQDYAGVLRITAEISSLKTLAFTVSDTIEIVEEREIDYEKQGIDTEEARIKLEAGRIAFEEERYREADGLLTQALVELDEAKVEAERSESVALLGKNFFMRYWWQILAILIVGALLARPAVKEIRKRRALKKLPELKQELKTTEDMLVKAQIACFKERKMSQDTYKARHNKYIKRIGEIKRQIPVFEAIAAGVKSTKMKEKKKGVLVVKK